MRILIKINELPDDKADSDVLSSAINVRRLIRSLNAR